MTVLPPLSLDDGLGLKDSIFLCREDQWQDFDLSGFTTISEIDIKSLLEDITTKFLAIGSNDRIVSNNLNWSTEKSASMGKMSLETRNSENNICQFKFSAVSGWFCHDLVEKNERLTFFITPKFLDYTFKSRDLDAYYDLAVRYIRTVIYSEEKYNQTFFTKNLSKISSLIPMRLLIPYFLEVLEELFSTGFGLPREYVTEYIEETKVTGRVDYLGYARKMFTKPHILPQHNTTLSNDSKYSRFILHGIHKAIEFSITNDEIDAFERLLFNFQGVQHLEMGSEIFEGTELPSTVLHLKEILNISAMFISESISVYDAASKTQEKSLNLLYSPHYIFEGVVKNLLTAAVKPLNWKCDDNTTKKKSWTNSNTSIFAGNDTDSVNIGAKTDHVIFDQSGNSVIVFESKHTSAYIQVKDANLADKMSIDKNHAEQLVISMITWETMRGMITAPFVENSMIRESITCKECNKLLTGKPTMCCGKLHSSGGGFPWAEFPITNLFGYKFQDDVEINKPRMYLLLIDTEVVSRENSHGYDMELERLRGLIEAVHLSGNVQGIIGTPLSP